MPAIIILILLLLAIFLICVCFDCVCRGDKRRLQNIEENMTNAMKIQRGKQNIQRKLKFGYLDSTKKTEIDI